MPPFSELIQTSDWKTEKHVPVIDAPDSLKKGEFTRVTVSVGKEVAHPNKTEHHICFIALYFLPNDEKFPYHLAAATFAAHGASTQGPDTSSVYTHHETTLAFKTEKPGTLLAQSYCNIHGLWQSEKKIAVK